MSAQQMSTNPIEPTTPTRLMDAFAQRVAAGDLDGLVDLYAEDSVFQPVDQVQFAGRDEIREALREMVDMRPCISFHGEAEVLVTGDLALVKNVWSMEGRAPDGSPVTDSGISADVVRRRPDGNWQVLIDQPRGSVPS